MLEIPKLNQLLVLITVGVCNVGSLLEQIKKASGLWHKVTDLSSVFFYIRVEKQGSTNSLLSHATVFIHSFASGLYPILPPYPDII